MSLGKGPMSILSDWASSMGAFRRNKVPAEKKVVAAALCNSGYSYRGVAAMIGGMSYIAARDAYLALVTSMPQAAKRSRREVVVDGEDFAGGSGTIHLWLARDGQTGEIMAFNASPGPTAEDAARFLASVGSQCANRPAVRLGSGDRAPKCMANLDLYFHPASPPSLIGRIGKLLLGNQ